MGTNRVFGIVACIALLLLLATGCSKNESRMPSVNNVDKVIQNQITEAENENNSEAQQDNTLSETKTIETNNGEKVEEEINTTDEAVEEEINTTNEIVEEEINTTDEVVEEEIDTSKEVVEEDINNSGEVDIDLTEMSSDMIYATVYQLMIDPNTYIGKTIKMTGAYTPTYYEPTNKWYHYVIIKDATACCEQGMEFVWEDGNHIYPDDYPDESAEIEVIGVFETYKEEGDALLYCRLKNSSLRIIK